MLLLAPSATADSSRDQVSKYYRSCDQNIPGFKAFTPSAHTTPKHAAPRVLMDPFEIIITVGLVVGFPLGLVVWKANSISPQSFPYLASFLLRRIIVPMVDWAFDWLSLSSYLAAGQYMQASAILAILVLNALVLSLVTAFWSAGLGGNRYTHLTVRSEGSGEIAWGCLCGLCQMGPLYLGVKSVRAWREITDSKWRRSDTPAATQEARVLACTVPLFVWVGDPACHRGTV